MFFRSVELNRFACLHQFPAEFPLYARLAVQLLSLISITHPPIIWFNVFQGPLEKSLQNSVVSERQRNVEHKVSAIKNSAQVLCLSCLLFTEPRFSHRHTWTTFKLGSSNAFATKLHQPFSVILRTSAQTDYSGHTWIPRFLQLLWVQPILKRSHSCELQADHWVQ